MKRWRWVQEIFDASADRYEAEIAPLLAPLVTDFAAVIARRCAPLPATWALDVGTGTGALARALAPLARGVCGVDVSAASLRIARETPAAAHLHYLRADIHRLPFADGRFALVAASLGLNATAPQRSLRALRRVLATEGCLAIQEWGPLSEPDRVFAEVFAAHIPQGASSERTTPHGLVHWSDFLQDADDYRAWLGEELGLHEVSACECAPVTVRVPTVDDFVRYKLAWTYRWELWRALPPSQRVAFVEAARAALRPFTAQDGALYWRPPMLRAFGRR